MISTRRCSECRLNSPNVPAAAMRRNSSAMSRPTWSPALVLVAVPGRAREGIDALLAEGGPYGISGRLLDERHQSLDQLRARRDGDQENLTANAVTVPRARVRADPRP